MSNCASIQGDESACLAITEQTVWRDFTMALKYKRILLKLSGEALAGERDLDLIIR